MGNENSTQGEDPIQPENPKNEGMRRYRKNLNKFWNEFNIEEHPIYESSKIAMENNIQSFIQWDGKSPFTPSLFCSWLREGKSIARYGDYAYGIIFPEDDKPERIRLSFNESYMNFDIDCCKKVTVNVDTSLHSRPELERLYEGVDKPQYEIKKEEMYILPVSQIPLMESPYTNIRFDTIGDDFNFSKARIVFMFLPREDDYDGEPREHKTKLGDTEVFFRSAIGTLIPRESYDIRANKGTFTKAARN